MARQAPRAPNVNRGTRNTHNSSSSRAWLARWLHRTTVHHACRWREAKVAKPPRAVLTKATRKASQLKTMPCRVYTASIISQPRPRRPRFTAWTAQRSVGRAFPVGAWGAGGGQSGRAGGGVYGGLAAACPARGRGVWACEPGASSHCRRQCSSRSLACASDNTLRELQEYGALSGK